MNFSPPKKRFRLAAIDLDGTLLGPDLTISGENLRAIGVLRGRGIEIVVASGRHYASIAPFLKVLPEVQWVVSVQGGEVSDRERSRILGRRFLNADHVQTAVELAGGKGLTPVAYGTDGIFIFTPANQDIEFYQHLSGLTPQRVSPRDLLQAQVFKVIWLGEPSRIDPVMGEGPIASGVERVRTHPRMVEFMPASVSKATGLQVLASHLGIEPGECIAFGDADNDIPMFQWAGLAVAMSHGWPSAKAAAGVISGTGAPETALARGIDDVLEHYLS